MRKIYFAISFGVILASKLLAGGSTGGGFPPSLETPMDTMSLLQAGALNGDLIRVTNPGYDPVLLRPDIGSIKDRSLVAHSLSTNDPTLFYARSAAENFQTKLALGVSRTLMASVGTLPIVPSEDFVLKPKVETVKVHELDAVRLDQALGGTGGGSTPPAAE